jgi:aminopeptidase N
MEQQPTTTYLADYKVPDFLIESVDLHFNLANNDTLVQSKLRVKRNGEHTRPLVLNGENLQLIEVTLDDQVLNPTQYRLEDETLVIDHVPDAFVLHIKNQINPEANTQLSGLFKSDALFCTQCEPQGFQRITYFIDRPDVLTRFTTTIEADSALYPILLSNGNLVERGESPNGRHWVKWIDPFKKPSYLFALVAGDLDCLEGRYQTRSGRSVLIRIFCEKGQVDRCKFALEAVYKAMRWDEEVFGREYDLDIFMIVAVNAFNMGAMENKGLNIFNAKFILADPQTATDVDFQNILGVVGHEYFHNWSGNRVTCRDWFQLSLKEGLTIFRDQEFSTDMGSAKATRIEEVKAIRTVQFTEDAGPMAHPVQPDSYIEINNFYTTTIYNKGAEVIRMMRTLLGRELFHKAMTLYFDRHDGQAVTIEEFVKAMEDASGLDLTQFRRWYKQAGTPRISIETHYDADKKTFTIEATQTCPATPNQPHKLPFHIPLSMGLYNQHGDALPLTLENETVVHTEKSRVLNLQKEKEIFCFKNIHERPIPSFLHGFSAPIKLNIQYSDQDLRLLFLHDTDGFSRWEAGQELALRAINHLVHAYQQGKALTVDPEFCTAFATILRDNTLDKAFITELLTLPSEAYLGEQMAVIDVDAIYTARRYLRETLAKQLKADWQKMYETNEGVGAFQHDLESIAKRSLKNTCLAYLMVTPDTDTVALCWHQFKNANNMTDKVSALALLANVDCKERIEALDLFYKAWKTDTLVLDKWFAVQARSELPDTLSKVKALMLDPTFDDKNPNKLRALIGTFTQANRVQFHNKNGEGYTFLTEQVCRLNSINPQVASRLLEPLTQWRKFDAARQTKMQACLQKIAQLPKLSKDIYELVTKSLA